MATLGEKVTETIVSALGRGLEGAGMSYHEDLKAIIAPRVEQYLALMDKDSPEYRELEHLTSNTNLVDVLLMTTGVIVGVIQSIFTAGEPWRERIRQRMWQAGQWKLPSTQELTFAWLRGSLSEGDARHFMHMLGYNDGAQDVIRSAMERPLDPDDVRELHLRGVIDAKKTLAKLQAAGISVEDQGLLMRLQWRIPPVNDLIRMAVREVFTPEIAQRFGQYADFPADVATYARMHGLTEEWAQRYWAAHWELPSVTQGFEMLHRGVITQADMDLLLRAQDVMPFWRDKISAIAYAPLTRVDVRRMYHLGVLDDAAVIRAYKDLGYNDANAARLLEFTKLYYGPEDEDPEEEDRELTKAEVLDGYRKAVLTADQARVALREMGYPDAKVDFYLAREDLKAEQSRKDAYVTRWRNLYINGLAAADDVYSNLEALGIQKAEVDELLPLWHLDKLMAVTRPTKAELTRWMKAGIITEAAWVQEMQLYGYSDKYISWYLAEIKGAPELAIQEESTES